MEYANAAWMHEVGSRPHESALTNHDPIITDTNLAEIDFEDFRNEDLAYAFSCGVSYLYLNINWIVRRIGPTIFQPKESINFSCSCTGGGIWIQH